MEDYRDQLDSLLLHQFDDGMLLSELDGYLTGLIVSPDLVPQSKWLKKVWGDAPPKFDDMADMQHFLDLLMHHYNCILEDLASPGTYEPILDRDTRNGDILWELWIEGFAQAMKLSWPGWNRIRTSDDEGPKAALVGITALASFVNDRTTMTEAEQARWNRQTPDLIPIWVQMLHEWRLENDKHRPASAKSVKVGRNDPCPCGSEKKYKKCCGLN